MTDLEMTMLCADAMGLDERRHPIAPVTSPAIWVKDGPHELFYNPLRDDSQAMALVKQFGLALGLDHGNKQWCVNRTRGADPMHTFNNDLNRAIVECVAKQQASHSAAEGEDKK